MYHGTSLINFVLIEKLGVGKYWRILAKLQMLIPLEQIGWIISLHIKILFFFETYFGF